MVEIASVAVDALGGDNAPGAIVQDAINATRKRISVRLADAKAVVRAEGGLVEGGQELARCRGCSQLAPWSV